MTQPLNLGILAHVDAGKTSLTERLLHHSGVIDEVGSVDRGSTRTDSLAMERRRGITIKSAVVAFELGGRTVNLIDTPGHPDFIAEVERVLDVLDGAVLVVSAVEGVQAQTRILWRALRRLGIPTLIFANKIDRAGAREAALVRELADRLDPGVLAMSTVTAIGTRAARAAARAADGGFTAEATDLLTEHDEALLADYVRDERAVTAGRLLESLTAHTHAARVCPVYFGSAATGAGVADLAAGIRRFLPPAAGSPEGPVSGTVFKIERGPDGASTAYVRLYSGTLRVRDRVDFGDGGDGKVTAVSVFDNGTEPRRDGVDAGRIARISGLAGARIGDAIGVPRRGRTGHFAPPTLETVVVPARRSDLGALHAALSRLAEQDPLIGFRSDPVRSRLSLSLYGEVQKEVIGDTLAEEYGLDVDFAESTVICVERLTGSGAAAEVIATETNPFLATVGLRLDPAPDGSGVGFRLGVELGSMPAAFFTAVEETVRETLKQGPHGWEVRDCTVTMTHSGYWARQSSAHGTFDKSMSSTAGDFRGLTPLVLADALRRAGTAVLEPIHRFRLDLPMDALGPVLAALGKLRAVPESPRPRGAAYLLEGTVPAASVHDLQQRLPGLTRGEGVVEYAFEEYRPVTGAIPTRPRTDANPFSREEYLLAVVRRVAGR